MITHFPPPFPFHLISLDFADASGAQIISWYQQPYTNFSSISLLQASMYIFNSGFTAEESHTAKPYLPQAAQDDPTGWQIHSCRQCGGCSQHQQRS